MTRVLLVVCGLAACQSGSTSPQQLKAQQASAQGKPGGGGPTIPQPYVTDGYRNDITSICDVVKLSGADKEDPGARQAVIAMWLGPHITTDEGHKFLIAIQPLQGAAKGNALDAEARRVGLGGCALAAEWRGSGAVNPL